MDRCALNVPQMGQPNGVVGGVVCGPLSTSPSGDEISGKKWLRSPSNLRILQTPAEMGSSPRPEPAVPQERL